MKKRFLYTLISISILITIIIFLCLIDLSYSPYERTVTKLSSKELRGRFPGDIGNEMATIYMEKQFKGIGLEGFSNNSYFQEFNIQTYSLDEQVAEMKIYYTDGTVYNCEYGKDFLEESKEKNINISAQFTLDGESKELNKYIILLDDHEQIYSLNEEPICILLTEERLVNNPSSKHRHAPVIKISNDFSKKMGEKPIEKIEVNLKFSKEDKVVKNVIGKIPGKNNKKAIVVSAHFDHVGFAGKQTFYGAIDNATGCAVLLEVAKGLSKLAKSNSFENDILICAFNSEELYLSGSETFVKDISNIYSEIYNINIDSVGVKGSVSIIIEGNDEANKGIKQAFSEYLKRKDIQYTVVSKGGLSDNISFEQSNIAAISISSERVDEIHTVMDTKNLVDFKILEDISKAVVNFINDNNGEIFKPDIPKISREELIKELPKIREEYAKDISYDELKVINYKGMKVILSDSAKKLSPQEYALYYPTVSLLEGFKDYALDSIKISTEPIPTSNGNKLSVEELEVDKVYKRDLSSHLFSSVSLYFSKDNHILTISFIKTVPNMVDNSYQPLKENILSYDKSFYKRFIGSANAICKEVEIDNQKYWIDVMHYDTTGEGRQYSEVDTIYEIQKGFEYEFIIRAIF